jgi:hypothetical protein
VVANLNVGTLLLQHLVCEIIKQVTAFVLDALLPPLMVIVEDKRY